MVRQSPPITGQFDELGLPECFYNLFDELDELLCNHVGGNDPADQIEITPSMRVQFAIEAMRSATAIFCRIRQTETDIKLANKEIQVYAKVYAPNIEKRLEDLAGSVGSIGTSTEGLSIADSLDVLSTTLQELGENLSIREETKSAKPRAPRKSREDVIEKARKRLGVEPAVPAPSLEDDNDDKDG